MKQKRAYRQKPLPRFTPTLWEAMEPRQLLSGTLIASPTDGLASPQSTFPAGGTIPPAASLTVAQIRRAYGLNGSSNTNDISFAGLTGDGTGQTIAIVTAYDNPKFVDTGTSGFATSDLAEFDKAMGIANPPSFKKVDQNGNTNYPGTNDQFANETAVDVEWAHAMAPGASILLVEAYSASLTDLINGAVQYARQAAGVSVVSMSFAIPEGTGTNEVDGSEETGFDSYFETPSGHQGVTFLAAAGDSGAPGGYPAFSPNVVSVGGTSLKLTSSNTISSETAWGPTSTDSSSTGGGYSLYEPAPSYQYGLDISSTKRMSPDVSFDGNANVGGVAVYDSYNGGASTPWYQEGGTSLAAPAWAGIIAVADQGRAHLGLTTMDGLTQTLPRLYELNSTSYHDITSGSNNEYSATTGYDLVSGLGSPIANVLIPDLAGGNSVSGTIFNDANGNGTLDSGESVLSGWGTFVDLYDKGVKEGLDPQVVSGSNGVYKFTDLPGGTYRFTETTPSGYKKTTAAYYTLTIGYGSALTGYNIGNQSTTVTTGGTGSIAGYVFTDANDDGKFEGTEKGLSGISVYLDKNNDGKEDSGDVILTSNSAGYFDFTSLANGTYIVREVLLSGQKLTTPTSGYYSVTITNGYNASGKYFGITGGGTTTPPSTGSISGYVFDDANDDGKFQSTEKVLSGVTVYLDKNNDGKDDSGDVVLTSNSAGYFDFTGLANGTYIVREVLPSGDKLSLPSSGYYSITIADAYNATGKDFGNIG